jgi:hypothetical protein
MSTHSAAAVSSFFSSSPSFSSFPSSSSFYFPSVAEAVVAISNKSEKLSTERVMAA